MKTYIMGYDTNVDEIFEPENTIFKRNFWVFGQMDMLVFELFSRVQAVTLAIVDPHDLLVIYVEQYLTNTRYITKLTE